MICVITKRKITIALATNLENVEYINIGIKETIKS